MAKNAITKLIFASFFQDLAVAMKKLGLNPTETEIQVNSLGSTILIFYVTFYLHHTHRHTRKAIKRFTAKRIETLPCFYKQNFVVVISIATT